MDESMQQFLKNLDAQIAAKKAAPKAGDRRKEKKPLPEGREERRKLADRRKARLAPQDKEKEE